MNVLSVHEVNFNNPIEVFGILDKISKEQQLKNVDLAKVAASRNNTDTADSSHGPDQHDVDTNEFAGPLLIRYKEEYMSASDNCSKDKVRIQNPAQIPTVSFNNLSTKEKVRMFRDQQQQRQMQGSYS